MVERTSSEITIKRRVNGAVEPVLTVPITTDSRRRFYLMQEDYVELKFNLETPVSFKIGDFIEDELFGTFFITEKQIPTFNEANGCYVYSLRFNAYYMAWENRLFMLTTNASGHRIRKETSWILTDTLENHVKEIINNLTVLGYTYGGNGFEYSILESATHAKEALSISYDGVGLITALNTIAETFQTEWWVLGNMIYFGKCENGSEAVFSLDTNMVAITPQRNQDVYANRVYFFGGTQNIPETYGKHLVFNVTEKQGDYFRDGTRRITSDMLVAPSYSGTTSFNTNPAFIADNTVLFTSPAFSVQKGAYYKTTVFGPSVKFLFTFYGTENYPSNLSGKWTLNLSLVDNQDTDFDGWMYETTGTVTAMANASTISENYRRVSVVATIPQTEIERSLIGGHTYTAKITVKAELTKEGPYDLQVFINSPKIEGNLSLTYELTKSAILCPLTFDGNDYTVIFNPYVVEYTDPKFDLFGFVDSSGSYTTPPTGFGVGSSYTLGLSDGTTDGLDITKVPISFWSTDYADPSSLMKIGENRLHLPTSTYPGGYLDSDAVEMDDNEEIVEKSVILDNIYPECVLKVTSIGETKRKDYEENSDGSDTAWNWIQYTLQATLENGDPFPFKKNYIKAGVTLQVRFLTPDEAGRTYDGAGGNYRLAGMTFDVLFGTDANGNPTYTIKRNDTYGALLPNDTLRPNVGDPFVLLGWDVNAISSLGLVDSAENKLATVAGQYVDALEEDQFIFRCRMFSDSMFALDSIYVQGQSVRIHFPALGGDKVTRVLGYTFKLDKPYDTPEYEVGETDVYSRLKQLENQIRNSGSASGTITDTSNYSSSSSTSTDVDLSAYMTAQEIDAIYAKKTDVPTSIPWGNIINTPTTIAGYGISDVYTKSEVDALIVNYFEEDGNGNIKLKDQYGGLWARGFVSAGGISEEGGGGGGGGGSDVTVLRSWGAYNENDPYEALGSNLGVGLKSSLDSLSTTVSSIDSRVTALETSTSNVSWGNEPADPGTVVDLTVNGTTKTLLKSNALEYSDKAVGLITETDFSDTLDTFFPIPS